MRTIHGTKTQFFLVLILSFILSFTMGGSLTAMAEGSLLTEDKEADLLDIVRDAISYEEFLEKHSGGKKPDTEIVIGGGDYIFASEGFQEVKEFSYLSGLLTLESGSVTYEVDVAEEGFYNLLFQYYPIEGKNSEIEREIYINGELPFKGADYIEFYRIWKGETDIEQDSRGNDIRPRQVESPEWISEYAKDSERFETKAYQFYFNKGKNQITIASVKEPMIIGSITLKQERELPSYEEYKEQNKNSGHSKGTLETPVKIQGEKPLFTSSSTLYPIGDRTSPLTEPYSPSKIRLNMIGGSNWKLSGQWITWDFEVPEDGLYEIAIKYKQNIKAGATVVRTLKLDGEVPFSEAKELYFYFKNDWQISTLSDGETPYEFYLTKGYHTISLEVGLGDELAEILKRTDETILNLNKAYRNMLMVIGSSPDTIRDYQLDKKTPDAIKILEEQFYVVSDLYEKLHAYSKGAKGNEGAIFDKLTSQLKNMYTKPDTIAKQWAAFKDNIVALGAWSLSMKEQPLEIDYILVQETDSKLPKAKAGFFAKVAHELRSFFASFVEDYDSLGEVYEGETLDVWVLGSGRDQAQVIKTLVDNYFVPEKNIPVNIRLVDAGILLSATLAGRGPDVALNLGGKEPVNYALRNAVTDLTQFPDYEEVIKDFLPQSLTPFTLEGGVYGLPETMSFYMMFYRADILKELGLKVPTNWDEFYECLSTLQKNNMNIGIKPDYTSFAMMLYQNGGEYYKDGGMGSGLDSEEAVKAFKQWTNHYANYKMPIIFDFANRFRTGEMPIGIGPYTDYNQLSVFAPEIKGLWGFTAVPGIERDGVLDKSVSISGNAAVILNTSDKKNDSWEFLKWWVSEETQSVYGNEIENILGVAGRVATANINALNKLPWTNRDYIQLMGQLKYVKAIPEIPGGYFTERHVTNAFYTVNNGKEDPRETLEDFVKIINNEITNKRKEFGMETAE